MNTYHWQNEIKTWVENKRINNVFGNNLIDFFHNAFNNTRIPDKSYFGSTDSSISILVGGIYLAANVYSGNDKGIWLLLDRELSSIQGIEYKPVLSTKTSNIKLTWLHIHNLENLSLINQNPDIWFSFSLASYKVLETPKGYSTRKDLIKNKRLLNSFWKQKAEPIDFTLLNNNLENNVSSSRLLSKEQRLERLKNAKSKPDRIETRTSGFIRNYDVIAEVLERANGICEVCRNPAPFNRDSDNSPYLEVHHKIPLSKSGADTVNNAIALCPNCHRHAHFGEKTFIIDG
ncbi:HNH endonuclease [candidate division KSB1 bacterium]|nr:HNH endonuclease [candidate division KSB1 bacterium]MBL7095817.1 HNH endonuclease [candidate division KSB1 bacterium]